MGQDILNKNTIPGAILVVVGIALRSLMDVSMVLAGFLVFIGIILFIWGMTK